MKASGCYSKKLLFLLIIIPLFFFSCEDSADNQINFGNPPTPETCFCDPDGVRTYLEWISLNYPEITILRTIGITESGRPIYALELSDNPDEAEKEPQVLINGAIHGDEQIAAGIPLKMIEHLVQGYYTEDPTAGDIIDNFKLHFIPALNPDGLASSTRYNNNNVDLNRNFGYNWDADTARNGDAAFDQKESTAVRNDFSNHGYCLSLNLHTAVYQKNIGIYAPWDAIAIGDDENYFIENYLPNYPFIEEIGETYASSLSGSGDYPFDTYFHYQEGADWYPFYGSMTDWSMGIHGTVCYTIELYGSQNFTTQDSPILGRCWTAHKDALLEMIQKAELGTGGKVTDSSGNAVADAEITLSEDSAAESFTPQTYSELKALSDAEGMFRLLTDEGTYNLSIEKDGFQLFSEEIILDGSGNTSIDTVNYEFFPEYSLSE